MKRLLNGKIKPFFLLDEKQKALLFKMCCFLKNGCTFKEFLEGVILRMEMEMPCIKTESF